MTDRIKTYKDLLDGNAKWVKEILKTEPDYFKKLSATQSPAFLWIGCSDSRVPANQITGTYPGEIFVHRNIANMVVQTDLNMLSVVEYAVRVLKVRHIIVCGHYGCGGVKAALSGDHYGLIDNWLINIKDVYRLHKAELDNISNENEKLNRLVELNAIEQAYNLSKTPIIQKSWSKAEYPEIHAWVYDLENGIIKELLNKTKSKSGLDKIYRYK